MSHWWGGSTPKPVGPYFLRNFISCGHGRGQNQTELPNHNPTPTPAWLGGAIARSNATPLPGLLPLGRRADGAPSRRITEPTSRKARDERQAIELSSFTLPPRAVTYAPRECGVPTPPRSPFRLLSSLALSCAWPFAVARATQVCRRNRKTSPAPFGESSLSRDPATRPLWASPSRPRLSLGRRHLPSCGTISHHQAPILHRLQSYPTIDVTDTSASRAWVHVDIDQPAQKTALIKASHKVHYRPEERAWGRTVPDCDSAVWSHGGNAAFCSRRPRKMNAAAPFCSIETNQVLRL